MMQLVDLHIHSNFSDGTMHPKEILKLAREAKLSTIALTDHDTVAGMQEMMKLDLANIEVIQGIELGAYLMKEKRTMHILAYHFDLEIDKVQEKIKILRINRKNRNLEMIEKMQKIGIPITVKEFLDSTSEATTIDSAGRPHFATYLIKKKIVQDFREAFDLYLSESSGRAFIPQKQYSPQMIIELIHELGAKTFIAHPNTLRLENNKLDLLVKKLKDDGLDGLEVFNSSIKNNSYSYFLKNLTKKYDLLYSAGSDFHGINKKDVYLGKITQNNKTKKLTSEDISPWFLQKK